MIHKALRVFRQFHKYTQLEVAERLGISKSYLSEIESGKKIINTDLLQKFADLYEMPVSSLVFFSETLHSSEKSIPKKFRGFVSEKVLEAMEWFISRERKQSIQA